MDLLPKKKKRTYKKKTKKTEETLIIETPKKPELPETPPHKGKDPVAWKNWYKQTIKNMINDDVSLDDIAKKLNIKLTSVNYFLK